MIPVPFKLLAWLDALWLAERRRRLVDQVVTPGAGLHGHRSLPFELINDVWWPTGFPTMAHCFWRAQEASLFRRHGQFITGKVLDMGCGDGIFGELAGFPDDATGVDLDQPSLEVRRSVCKHAESVCADARELPFRTGTFQTVVSNSVFEHLPDLAKCLAEICRVLASDGCLAFTMTLQEFTRQLERMTGARDAAYWIGTFGHLQQPTRNELELLLEMSGFELSEVAEYQPEWATAIYRRLVSPLAQFNERRWSPERRGAVIGRLTADVKRSLQLGQHQRGACIWVVAHKRK